MYLYRLQQSRTLHLIRPYPLSCAAQFLKGAEEDQVEQEVILANFV